MIMKKFLTFLFLVFSFFLLLFFNFSVEVKKETKEDILENIPLLSKPKKIEIILAGDIMLGRSVLIKSLDQLHDVNYPFLKVSDYLKRADLVFVNLESPVVTDCPRFEHGYTFCTDPKMIDSLLFGGVDIVNLANNHILNFGKEGLENSKKYLSEKGILYTGIGNLVIKKIEGTTFGFLGFDFTVNIPTQKDWNLIKDSDSEVDILIVGVHWGEEYKDKANKNQREWAREMIENGADVVSGHHPHWVQDYEYVNGKPVYYSLGNFIFDQMWSEETKKGLLVKLTYEDEILVNEEFENTYIENIGQPKIIE